MDDTRDSDIRGNINIALYMHVAKEMSIHSEDLYEKAIYGFVCGRTESVFSVAEDWEDFLWATINSLYHQKLSNVLYCFSFLYA
jgi:nuclear pore complex protein Nup107